jgi:hypothetical protein
MLLRSYDMIFWKHGSSMGRHKDGRLEPRSRLSMTNLRLRNTRRQGRTCIPDSVSRSRAVAGDPLEPLGVLHSTERVVMVTVVLLLMMMRLMITELSQGRGRALTEV